MTDTATLLDWLAAFLLVSGAFFSLVAGVGLFVLPDLLARMHAAAKPQVLGLLLMLAGLAIEWRSWVWLPVLLLAWVTQMVTAPVASHLVGRTGYRTKHARRELLHRDELAAVVVVVAGRLRPRGPRGARWTRTPCGSRRRRRAGRRPSAAPRRPRR
ncbi:monovalent cation/H(+) antiporter subunit G [Micrococcus luteus]|nr:monovalent cation/H(+) antiporter subunit G [Micrococcus luteus]